jgi:Ca2+-binding EF-hand superfamily protein
LGFALADADQPSAPPHPGHPVVAVLDADRDGAISAEEIGNAAAALQSLDANGDGNLTPDELRPPRPEGAPEGPPGGPIMRHDADGDGFVTLEEFIAPAADVFARIDVSADGKIDESEAEAAAPPPPGRCHQKFSRRGGPRVNR